MNLHILTARLAAACLAVALTVTVAPDVAAQTTGSVSGTVFDQTGTPIAGVQVQIASPTQIGGTKTAITNDEGRFRFVQLAPGSFRLEARAPKLKTYVQTGIRVFQNKDLEVDIIMEVDTDGQVEEYTIEEKAPLIDTQRASIGESFDAEFLDQLPLGQRDYQGVATLTPGVVDSTNSGNPSIMGGSFFNNKYTIDGFDTTDPVTGTFGSNFSFDAIAAEQVLTAGYGIENSDVLGGVINVVTKSGSNKLEINTSAVYEDYHLQLFRDNLDREGRFAQLLVSVGGPIIKDRLWYFVSTQFSHGIRAVPLDPTGQLPPHAPRSVLSFTGFSKITWQLSPRHKIEFKTQLETSDFRNLIQSPVVENAAEARQTQRATLNSLLWSAILTDDLIANVGASFFENFLDVGPQSCLYDDDCLNVPGEIDLLTGIQRNNYTSRSRSARRIFEFKPTLEWYLDHKKFGTHQLKLGAKVQVASNPSAITVPGDQILLTAGNEPFARSEVCVNDPLASNGECRSGWLRTSVASTRMMYYIGDQWRFTRYLTLTPQLALHRSVMYNDLDKAVLDVWALTPHLYVAWDPTHDGKTKLSAGYSEYVDTGFLALARFSALQLTERQCLWDDNLKGYVRNCRTFGGEGARTIGLPCGPDGLNPDGTPCTTKLRAPKKLEWAASAEREVWTGIVLGLNVVYRRFERQWEDLETNAIWNQSGTEIRPDGGFRNGRSQFVYDLETPSSARKRYLSFTPLLRKREGRFKVMASYTWTQFRGTDNNTYQSNYLDNPGQTPFFYGPLPEDFRHNVKFQANYQALAWLALGVNYDFLSGGPYNRFFADPVFNSFSRFGARRGYDSGGDLNPDNDRELRLPDLSVLGVQVRVNLRSLIKQQLEMWVDAQNMLALRTTTAVIEQNGPFFEQPISRLPPLSLRVGLRYRY